MSASDSRSLIWLANREGQRSLRLEAQAQFPSHDQLCFYLSDFAQTEGLVWWLGEEVDLVLGAALVADPPVVVERAAPDWQAFARVHDEILHLLASGSVQKLVPCVLEQWKFNAPLSANFFHSVVSDLNENRNFFGFELQAQGVGMAGVTPEVLFSVTGDKLTTMALAGTAPATQPEKLKTKKEQREHEMVIHNLMQDLQSLGRVSVGSTGVKPYGNLLHLHTPVEVTLDQPVTYTTIVEMLHPTAALGGWPRLEAKRWLRSQDFHLARRRFGAPFGWQKGERMECVVAIRGIQWDGSSADVWAGCGVVIGSEFQSERRELELKIENLGRMLGLRI